MMLPCTLMNLLFHVRYLIFIMIIETIINSFFCHLMPLYMLLWYHLLFKCSFVVSGLAIYYLKSGKGLLFVRECFLY
jgi:hypothetical protein